MRAAAWLAIGALVVALFALSVSAWAMLAVLVPRLRRALFAPDELRWGNCHVYVWLKYLNDGGRIKIRPSSRCKVIPHASIDGREFVPDASCRGVRALIHSFGFYGHVRAVKEGDA